MTGGLTRARILRGRKNFLRVREEGRTERSHLLSLGVLPVAPGAGLKIGFITPKHLGKAHDRNRLRRRLKEIVRLSGLSENAPCWLVVVARHAAADAEFAELRQHWLRLARRARLPFCADFPAPLPASPPATSPPNPPAPKTLDSPNTPKSVNRPVAQPGIVDSDPSPPEFQP